MRKDTYETPYMDRVQVVMEEGIMLTASFGEGASDSKGGLEIVEQNPGVAIGEDVGMSIKDEWKDGDGHYTWD